VGKHRHNHIVTRRYLDLFAEAGFVACHPAGEGPPKEISTKDAGVRSNFYAYRRPDGTRSTSVEEAMGPLETQAVPLLRTIESRWPIEGRDRATLAEYLALQLVRVPAWRSFHDELRDRVLDRQEAEREAMDPEHWQDYVASMRSDAHRSQMMLRQVPKIGSLLLSMQWTLLRFGSARLLTSDHPVVPVEIGDDPAAPRDGIPRSGFANVGELRFPVSPRHALLLCWADEGDADLRGHPQQARIINHSVKEQAEIHWFCPPSASPSHNFGDLTPLTFGLVRGYNWNAIERSRRRETVLAEVNKWIETQETVRELTMVKINVR
jgi:hypothetical protein